MSNRHWFRYGRVAGELIVVMCWLYAAYYVVMEWRSIRLIRNGAVSVELANLMRLLYVLDGVLVGVLAGVLTAVLVGTPVCMLFGMLVKCSSEWLAGSMKLSS